MVSDLSRCVVRTPCASAWASAKSYGAWKLRWSRGRSCYGGQTTGLWGGFNTFQPKAEKPWKNHGWKPPQDDDEVLGWKKTMGNLTMKNTMDRNTRDNL